ncbi:3-carboxy-cis,cis-mucoante lactonizing enzyme [Stipitochalara longipes BDJ]|nr:3-carboxy-cis,cis-mucoante lactonizing enzyme [Stipitochalara longipes BDJ]
MTSNFLSFVLVFSFLNVVLGDLHRLFVGNLAAPSSIHLLVFDDDALTLNKTATIKASDPHYWITFDQNKQNIYGVSGLSTRIASYSVHLNQNTNPNSTLRLDRVLNYTGNCFNKSSAFVIQSPKSPNAVYASQWPGPAACGSSFKTLGNGTLSSVLETWKYSNDSGIHGLAFGPNGDRLYSADLSGDRVWTHSVGNDGKVAVVGTLQVPSAGMHPRHLVAHSGGQYLYVVFEAGNALIEYSLDEDTETAKAQVNSYSLIPTGANTTKYWSAEVMLSSTEKYLWATTRPQTKTNLTGLISCFELNDSGAIQKKLFSVPITDANTNAVAISPAPFDDQWAALADQGYVQIWQLKNGTGRYANTTGAPVATVKIPDGGCCANAIWYD